MNEDKLMGVYKQMHDDLKKGNFVTDKSGSKLVEVINYHSPELDPMQKELKFNGRKTPLKYVEKESKWYNSMDRNIKGHVDDVKIWRDVSDNDGMVNSNYGWCIFSPENFNQYDSSLETLVKNPESRRATMIYNRPSMQEDFDANGMNDFVCTYSTQQFIRDNKLIYIVNQRAQDMVFGLFNDLAWHQEVYGKMLGDLREQKYPELEVGNIQLNVGSAHVYERHFDMLEKMVEK